MQLHPNNGYGGSITKLNLRFARGYYITIKICMRICKLHVDLWLKPFWKQLVWLKPFMAQTFYGSKHLLLTHFLAQTIYGSSHFIDLCPQDQLGKVNLQLLPFTSLAGA